MGKDFQAGWYFDEHTGIKERLYLNCYTPVNIDKWFNRIQLKSEIKILLLKIYRKIGGLEGICELLNKEELKSTDDLIDRRNLACCQMDGNQLPDFTYFFSYASNKKFFYLDTLDKAMNISINMKERMKLELSLMCQRPIFRIEEVMNDCNVTHSTATKMVNLFVELKLVKQVNDKQRYRVFEYAPLMECIQRI